MAEQQANNEQMQFLLSDFNTRLRDVDERNKLIRERVLLLGENLISSRQDVENELQENFAHAPVRTIPTVTFYYSCSNGHSLQRIKY